MEQYQAIQHNCDKCDEVFMTPGKLQNHRMREHPETEKMLPERLHEAYRVEVPRGVNGTKKSE